MTRQAQCPPHHLWFLASSPDSSVQPSSRLGPEQVGRKGRQAHRCVSQFPFPSAGGPWPHDHFLLQEGEQVLPGPLLPHHCALQVRTGLEGVGGWVAGQAQARGP